MRRICPALVVLLLAACSSVPQQSARAPGMTIATPRAPARAPANFPNFVDHSVGQEEISIQAMSLVGVPYRWGGNTPDSGFDCSGLVRYVVSRAADVNLPRTTADISVRGESIEPDQVAPGDLIFFNTTGRPHSHVGIYVGKLRFVNAPSTGGTVRLDYLTNPYWAKRFDGIRRVAPTRGRPAPFDAPVYEARNEKAPVSAPAVAPITNAGATPPAVVPARTAVPTTIATRPTTVPAPAPVIAAATDAADPYEPPPSHMTAAQRQATAAAAIPPATATATVSADTTATSGIPIPTIALDPTSISGSGDAFEPPPTARAAAGQSPALVPDGVQILRASTQSAPRHPSADDDPIARFATGSY